MSLINEIQDLLNRIAALESSTAQIQNEQVTQDLGIAKLEADVLALQLQLQQSGPAGGGEGPARLLLDGVDEDVRLAAPFSADSATRLPACTICIGVKLPDPLSVNVGLFRGDGGTGMVDGFVSAAGILSLTFANDFRINAFNRRPRMTVQSAVGALSAGDDALITLTFDGTAPANGPSVGDAGVGVLYVNGVEVTQSVLGATTNPDPALDILTSNGVGFLTESVRQIAIVEGQASATQVADLATAYAAKDPDAFSTKLAEIGVRRVDVPVLLTDDATGGTGTLENRGTQANATPINTEAADLVSA